MRIRTSVPPRVARGEVFEVKTLVTHPMHNGFMYNANGERIPRFIINRFEAFFDQELVFRADWHEAVAPNPFIAFHATVEESGTMEFRWYDDDGTVHTEFAEILVT